MLRVGCADGGRGVGGDGGHGGGGRRRERADDGEAVSCQLLTSSGRSPSTHWGLFGVCRREEEGGVTASQYLYGGPCTVK